MLSFIVDIPRWSLYYFIEINRPSIIRVCVEVDVLKSITKRVWIGCGNSGFWQDVLVKDKPKCYKNCANKRGKAKD